MSKNAHPGKTSPLLIYLQLLTRRLLYTCLQDFALIYAGTLEVQAMATLTTAAADAPIEFGNITEANLDQLRKLNLSTFPVRYNDKFYQVS